MTPEQEAELLARMQSAFDEMEREPEKSQSEVDAEVRVYNRIIAGAIVLALLLVASMAYTMISISRWMIG